MKPSEWLAMVAAHFDAGAQTMTAACADITVDEATRRVAEAYLVEGIRMMIETDAFGTDPPTLRTLCGAAAFMAEQDGR